MNESYKVRKRGGNQSQLIPQFLWYILISSTFIKSYALEEAYIVWEEVLIEQEEESILTGMPLSTTIHNKEITLKRSGQLTRVASSIAKLKRRETCHNKTTL